MELLREFERRKADAAVRNREGAARTGVRRPAGPSTPRPQPVLSLRYLYRWMLGTPYPQIVADVGGLLTREPLKGMTALIVDYTGVGRPIGDLFTQAKIAHIALTITSGKQVITDGNEVQVPKRDLAMVVQSLLQSDRLRFAATLPLLDLLKTELQSFEVKVTNVGNDSYEAWRRDGAHDDVVLATAMACWYRERTHPADSHSFVYSYDTRVSSAPAYPLD
jgi:hypothetical protein